MNNHTWLCGITLFLLAGASGPAQEFVAKIPASDFERLHAAIKPQRGESPWRDIAWLTSVTEARRRAVARLRSGCDLQWTPTCPKDELHER